MHAVFKISQLGFILPISLISFPAFAATSVRYISPTGNIKVNNPKITGSATKVTGAAAATVTLNGGPSLPCTLSNGAISCSTSGLTDQNYIAAITIRDRVNKLTATGSFRVDTVAPIIGSVQPSGIIKTTSTNVTVTYSDAGSGISTPSAKLTLDGVTQTTCTVSTSQLQCSVSGLSLGSHSIGGSIADNAGNVRLFSGSFTIATTIAPTITYTGSTGYTNLPVISATYLDNSGVGINSASVAIMSNGVPLTCTPAASQVTCDTSTLTEGPQSLLISVSDNAANTSILSDSFAFDKTPPAVTYVSPIDTVTTRAPTITGTVSDASPFTASAVLTGPLNQTFGCTVTNQNLSCPTSGLPNGTYAVVIQATDSANNVGNSASSSFTVSTIHPTVTYTGSTGFTNSPLISATYSDNSDTGIDMAGVTVTDGGVALSCTATTTQVSCSTSALTEGQHSLSILVSDNTGNSTSVLANFTYDKTLPSVTNVQPIGTVNTAPQTITASYSDSLSGIDPSTATLSLDGTTLTGCTASTGNISCPVTNVSQGAHTIGGSVSDNASNSAPISGSFTFATIRTVVTLTFDDGRKSQANAGFLLASYGVYGTFYINSGLIASSSYYMLLSDVQNIAAAGHEIGGHTLDHANLTTVSTSTALNEVCADQAQIQAWGFPGISFAYPYGATNPTVEQIVSSCKESGYAVINDYMSARTIGGLQCNGCAKANSIPPIDPFRVMTDNAGGPVNTTTLAYLVNEVVNAESTGGWLVIPFHSICNAPANAPYPGNTTDCNGSQYANDYSLLDQLLNFVVQRASLGTVIMTTAQAMGAQLPPPPPPPPPPNNLVYNPSFEISTNGTTPDGYTLGGFGTNTFTYTRTNTGAHTGTYAEQLSITSLTSGNRKIVTSQSSSTGHQLIATPGATYNVGIWYKSTLPTFITVYYHDSTGWNFLSQAPTQPASSNWIQATFTTPAMPSTADLWSFGATLTGVGTLTVDDFSSAQN